jgi:hypothetical protein
MLTIEEVKLRLLEAYDFAAVARRAKMAKKELRKRAEAALDTAFKAIDDKTGETSSYFAPMLAIARRAPIAEGGLARDYAGKICVRLDLFYAPMDKQMHIATIEEAGK